MNAETEGFFDRLLRKVTQLSLEHARLVVVLAGVFAVATWSYASQLRIEGSFVALLPTDSETGARFSETLDRKVGGNATLIVVVRSSDADKNRGLVDALAARFSDLPTRLVHSVEKGPGEARDFFLSNKWLFAPRHDLELLECKLEREVQRRRPGYLGLEEDPCEQVVEPPRADEESEDLIASSKREKSESPSPRSGEVEKEKEKEASALSDLRERLDQEINKLDRYPSGYFSNDEGTVFSIMIRAPTAGMGEFSSDELFSRVKDIVALESGRFGGVEVGYAGDIPNAIAQRDALVSDMATISLIAVALILGSIVVYFRSLLSLLQIGYCVTVGCGGAFAIAMLAYGRLNTATSFLGAIIFGNGINYSIVYLSSYRELRMAGHGRDEALLQAALESRKGTWLASVATGGAYAALLSTSFRGFSEFGLIGGVGMVLCWLSTFIVLPAAITASEKYMPGTERRLRPTVALHLDVLGRFVRAKAGWVLAVAAALSIVAAYPLPKYVQDPWEYNFSRLGSSKSKTESGAGSWSKEANQVFRSRGSPMLMMADDRNEALSLEAQLREQDRLHPDKTYIERVDTIFDRLGGTPETVERKLRALTHVRELIDEAMPRLNEEDKQIAREYRPPESLGALTVADLPDLVASEFMEKDGTVGTPLYVYLGRGISQSNGKNLLAIADIFENVHLKDGRVAPNASRSAVFAAMIRAMEHDGPFSTFIAFLIVSLVTFLVTRNWVTSGAVLGSLLCGVLLTVGGAAWLNVRLNFLNFVALPLTFGIGVEYAINIFERIKAKGSIEEGLRSMGGPVALCSLTTILGYGALIFADNMALQSFGRYAMAGEFSCIITALFVLPAVLSLSKKFN